MWPAARSSPTPPKNRPAHSAVVWAKSLASWTVPAVQQTRRARHPAATLGWHLAVLPTWPLPPRTARRPSGPARARPTPGARPPLRIVPTALRRLPAQRSPLGARYRWSIRAWEGEERERKKVSKRGLAPHALGATTLALGNDGHGGWSRRGRGASARRRWRLGGTRGRRGRRLRTRDVDK